MSPTDPVRSDVDSAKDVVWTFIPSVAIKGRTEDLFGETPTTELDWSRLGCLESRVRLTTRNLASDTPTLFRQHGKRARKSPAWERP